MLGYVRTLTIKYYDSLNMNLSLFVSSEGAVLSHVYRCQISICEVTSAPKTVWDSQVKTKAFSTAVPDRSGRLVSCFSNLLLMIT